MREPKKRTKIVSKYKTKWSYGLDLEYAMRVGILYEPYYKELSFYVGPFRFWLIK